MSRNLKRMLFALVATAVCYGSTEYWYRAGMHLSHSTDGRSPVAKLNESNNEVQRKEVKRVIWESVSRNDELFAGEAIRTSNKAEAQILLLKSGTTIHLEPDSLVVLEENANGLALDFLQGNLFVQGGSNDNSQSGLTLKTGAGEIKLQSADMSLSKDQSGQVNLEVFKGQAELEHNGQKLALAKDKSATLSDKGMSENKDRVVLLSPKAGDTVLLNLVRGEKLDLAWKPLSPDYKISAEIGTSRSKLKKVSDSLVTGEVGKLSLTQKPGKWFLRLSAHSETPGRAQLTSMVIPFTVEPKSPPALVQPSPDIPVIRSQPQQDVEFRWMNRNSFESQILEVAKDPLFKAIAFKNSNLSGEDTSTKTDLSDGTYFWRVTGYLKNKGKLEGLSSPAQKLQIVSNLEIKAATLLGPADHAQIAHADALKNGVTLKWQPVLGVKRYKVLAQRKSKDELVVVAEKEIESPLLKLSGLKPGEYVWSVTSLGPKEEGGGGKASETFDFTIADLPKLEWAQAEATVDYNFSTPTPSLAAHWTANPEAASYRYRVFAADNASPEEAWQSTKQDRFDLPLKDEGKYLAVVEALNAKGQTVARSDLKTFNVKRLPLLPAPRWAGNTPAVLKTDAKGNLSFGWEEVEGAERYLMILENAQGKAVEERQITRTTASVSRLKPGQYKVKVRAVDAFKRSGGESESRSLEVPNTSDIKAPKIKAMKVN